MTMIITTIPTTGLAGLSLSFDAESGDAGNAVMRASGPLVALREAPFEPLCRRPAGHHHHSGQLHDMNSEIV